MKPGKHRNKRLNYKILFEDRDIIVIDKPSGMLTVPIPNMKSLNVEDLLNKKFDPAKRGVQAAHRIDRYTSGIVVFARTHRAHKNLVEQFRSHTPGRGYLALVRGIPNPLRGELVHHMKRIKDGFRNIVVPESDPEGTRARLEYITLSPGQEVSLVKIFLDTGLKNQIRVQLTEMGCPVVGDRHYNEKEKKLGELNRQALHAVELSFDHPRSGQRVTFNADIPGDMMKVMRNYGLQ